MFLSIVIPVYNVSYELLTRCLESALSQIDENDEIVIVDDGSLNKNSKVYQNISKSDKRIKYFKQENSGPSYARNCGVMYSQGEYILFLDSDDYLVQGSIFQAKKLIRNINPDIIFGYVYKDLMDEGKVINKNIIDNPEIINVYDEDKMAVLLNHILGYENEILFFKYGYISDGPWARFFKRELFTNTEFDLTPRWNEDTLWNIEILRKCKNAVVCKSLWYIYAVRKGSATQGYRINCFDEFNYITKRVSDVGHSLWNGNIDKGISYRVWHDLFFLSRSWIFNDKNPASKKERFECYKAAVTSKYYKNAISTVDFKFEKRIVRKFIKEILNLLYKFRFFHIAYKIVEFYVGIK